MLYIVCRAVMTQDGTYTRKEMSFETWSRIILQNKAKLKSYVSYQSIADFLTQQLRVPIVMEKPKIAGLVYNSGDLIMEVQPLSKIALKRCRKDQLSFSMIVYQGRDARGLAMTMDTDW